MVFCNRFSSLSYPLQNSRHATTIMADYSDEETLVFPSSDQENMATEPDEGSYDGQSEPAENEAQWLELFHQYDMNHSDFEQKEYMFSDTSIRKVCGPERVLEAEQWHPALVGAFVHAEKRVGRP